MKCSEKSARRNERSLGSPSLPALLRPARHILERRWPVAKLREFALARLDRLAGIEHVDKDWYRQPLRALLASVRHSERFEDRELLGGFVVRAAAGAREVASHVLHYGMTYRGHGDPAPDWEGLPPHKYAP